MQVPERLRAVKIRVGQRWRYTKTGVVYVVRGKRDAQTWAIQKEGYTGTNNHGITEKTLKLWYRPL